MTESNSEEFITEIKSQIEQTAVADGGDIDVYLKLIQAVLSNGMGMEAVSIKKPTKVSFNEIAGTFKGQPFPMHRL